MTASHEHLTVVEQGGGVFIVSGVKAAGRFKLKGRCEARLHQHQPRAQNGGQDSEKIPKRAAAERMIDDLCFHQFG